ncbi:MAG: heat-inducible transcriptional repressor HrcA [Candidatus Limnocylindrales bacterium]|jgi:heat-inducible transcriptional repressor
MARRPRRTIGSLDTRSDAILRAVIDEYVTSATPVSSGSLVEHYPLGVSSATVRNILSDLEALGLLTHPHTSAGRVPTDAGYRYYVQVLAGERSLPAVEQRMIRHQFGQVEFASEHWFRLAASTLAANTGTAGLATTAKPRAARVRRVDLVAVQDRALLVVLFREGTMKQTLQNLPAATDQDQLDRVAALLNVLAVDRTADEIGAALTDLPAGEESSDDLDLLRRIGDTLVRTMREFDAALIDDLFSDGLLNVMAAPEFDKSDKVRAVFAALENRAYLGSLVESVARAGSIQILIGHENRPPEMQDVSLVLAPYGRIGHAIGVVGVLGPTRMPYAQAIASVDFVSGLMNELVEHLYA